MAFLLYLMLSDSCYGNIKTYPSMTFFIFILICFHLNWRDKEKKQTNVIQTNIFMSQDKESVRITAYISTKVS